MRYLNVSVGILGFALLNACVTPVVPEANFVSAKELLSEEVDEVSIGTKDLLFLKNESHFVSEQSTKYGAVLQSQQHQAAKILTKQGLRLIANPKFELGRNSKLVRLEARTIKPSGEVVELDPNDVTYEEATFQGLKYSVASGFRFPQVEVGDIVEVILVRRIPFAEWSGSSSTVDYIDSFTESSFTKEDKQTYYFDPDTGYRLRASNLGGLKLRKGEAGKYQTLTLEGTWDPKPVPPIPYARASAYRKLRWDMDYFGRATRWKDVVERAAAVLYVDHRRLMVDAPALVLDPECGDVKCVISAALEEMRGKTTLRTLGGSALRIRKLKDMIENGDANGFERAFWMFKLLQTEGVDARFAFTTRRNTNPVDKSFPNAATFNHLLLKVGDGEQAIWVDPSCDWCKVGELPDRVRDVPALLTTVVPRVFYSPRTEVEWVSTTGAAPKRATAETKYNVQIFENGDVDVEMLSVESGEYAEDTYLTVANSRPHTLNEGVRKWAERVFPTAEVIRADIPRCEIRSATCVKRRVLRFPQMAIQDGERVRLFTNHFDEPDWRLLPKNKTKKEIEKARARAQAKMTPEEREKAKKALVDKPLPTRKEPIIFSRRATKDVTIRVTGWPSGWQVANRAESRSGDAEHVRASRDLRMDGKDLVFKRKLELEVGWYEATNNDKFAEVFDVYKVARGQTIDFKGRLKNKATPPAAPKPAPPPPAPADDKDKVEEPPAG